MNTPLSFRGTEPEDAIARRDVFDWKDFHRFADQVVLREYTDTGGIVSPATHRRSAATMTHAEIENFLEAGHTMIVGSHGPDGTIHLAPMRYAIVDGRQAMWTYSRSQKALNLRRNPSVTLLVEDGQAYQELRGVQLAGRAEIVDDPEDVLRIGAVIHRKYQGSTGEDAPEIPDSLRRQAKKRIVVLVTPERTASWDHRKLGGTY